MTEKEYLDAAPWFAVPGELLPMPLTQYRSLLQLLLGRRTAAEGMMPKSANSELQPRRFLVSRKASKVDQRPCWAVRQGERWRLCEDLTIQVTVATVDVAGEGACLSGVGVVRTLARGAIVITA